MEEAQYLISYDCYWNKIKVPDTEGMIIIWAYEDNEPKIGDYDIINVKGFNMERRISEVVKLRGKA